MKRSWRLVFAILAATMLGCAAEAPQAAQGTAGMQLSAQGERSPDRFIFVTAQGLPGACYQDLGSLTFTEPYTDAAIDPNSSNAAQHLRTLALQRYPQRVDAVIGVHSDENDVGTMVTVSGEAVELQHRETVECAMRKVPGALNTAAATAAGGMAGTLVGGLTTTNTNAAMGGAAGGMAIAGGYEAMKAHQQSVLQHNQLVAQLQSQRHEIAYLQAERDQLQQCLTHETPLAQCTPAPAPVGPTTLQAQKAEAADWSAPPYQLQSQVQEQQLYIKQLNDQILQARQRLSGK